MSMVIAPAYGVGGTAGGGGAGGGGGGPLTVTVSATVIYGGRSSPGPVTVPSENVTLTVTGGTGTYTIAWEAISVPDSVWTITAPASLTTKFSVINVDVGDTFVGTFRALVSDGVTSLYSDTVESNNYNTGLL